MMVALMGDADYGRIGVGYARHRRTDPRIAALVHAALGDAQTVVNIGAGAGSYEPSDRHVLPIEPSPQMRRQRPSHLAPAIHGVAGRFRSTTTPWTRPWRWSPCINGRTLWPGCGRCGGWLAVQCWC
jgi:hypothetical protein